jgi:hypothetical protein
MPEVYEPMRDRGDTGYAVTDSVIHWLWHLLLSSHKPVLSALTDQVQLLDQFWSNTRQKWRKMEEELQQ